MPYIPNAMYSIAASALLAGASAAFSSAFAANPACRAESGAGVTPVIELYTSEGCSSCPPADQWLSTLKTPARQGKVVVQAFHVAYWDSIGWADRFASPAHTARQKQVASWNGLRSIYTPQLVRNGQDWRDYGTIPPAGQADERSRTRLQLQRTGPDAFEASVTPAEAAAPWSAYWSVTEHGHSSKVKAGENAGEFLQHDFVVRQYVPVGNYRGPQTLTFNAIPGQSAHARQVNLVVHDGKTGKTLQALSLACES